MNIALIGGVERRQTDLRHLTREAGHQLEYHSGDMGGGGAARLRSLIERADLVVFQTAINSHGSMYFAKRSARQLGREFVVVRKCGPARWAAFLTGLAAG
ncbi:MAG TPA: DUF2325 domain-containing protein [Polyangiaceae bacterium]|nr:DUF2325 domain-containing protein [Polyangiaceae bacterium]